MFGLVSSRLCQPVARQRPTWVLLLDQDSPMAMPHLLAPAVCPPLLLLAVRPPQLARATVMMAGVRGVARTIGVQPVALSKPRLKVRRLNGPPQRHHVQRPEAGPRQLQPRRGRRQQRRRVRMPRAGTRKSGATTMAVNGLLLISRNSMRVSMSTCNFTTACVFISHRHLFMCMELSHMTSL